MRDDGGTATNFAYGGPTMMLSAGTLEIPQFVISVCGLGLSVVAGIVALRSFRRAEKWKKAEFLAAEMKLFFENDLVRMALSLIDWGTRRIQLDPIADPSKPGVIVTREMQLSALRPHVLLNLSESDSVMDGESIAGKRAFTPDEARIRDCYDAFLDGLERVANCAKTNLIEISALRPYVGYWITDIHAPTKSKADAAYTAALLTYIKFYGFEGVLWLFSEFGCQIDPSSNAYAEFLSQMDNQNLAVALARTVDLSYTPSRGHESQQVAL